MVDTVQETICKPKFKGLSLKIIFKFTTLTSLALILGYIHYIYVSTIYENVTHFSHLSDTEREMSLYSESAFYYSYYKTLVEERPFLAGISKLMYDHLVEHPNDVNAFNRFNIHPEVVIGSLYRYLEPWINGSRVCHTVSRGGGLSPVESCTGAGTPAVFYLGAVWALAGLAVAALFLHATALSETILGGLLAVAQYFANHVDCTRVQWSPNQRENMAVGMLLLQAWLLGLQLRACQRGAAFTLQVSVVILNCLCLLFWQFSQFVFLTQTAIFFVMEQLRIIDAKTLCIFLHSHFCGLHMAVLLLHGNDMLKTSLYASFFLVVSAYCLFFSSFRIKVQNRLDLFVESWLVLLRICTVICTSVYLKKVISDFLDVQEDTHVWEILYSKFTNYKTFHTLLYTCSKEFDFLPFSSIKNMMQTFLIPFASLSIFIVCNYWLGIALSMKKKETERKAVKTDKDSDTDDSGIENTEIEKQIKEKQEEVESEDDVVRFLKLLRIDSAVFYNVSQMVVYGVMAALVMRLKMLFTTQLCVVSSLMMNKKYYLIPKSYCKFISVFWALCLLPLAHRLMINTTEELSLIGTVSNMAMEERGLPTQVFYTYMKVTIINEYTNVHLEEMLDFIRSSTSQTAAFAGALPTLAAVLLNTRRPVVAHPHYEHLAARQRAYSVLKTYGRFSSHDLYQELSKLKVSYLIVETSSCYGQSSAGCTFTDLWDTEVPSLSNRPRLCHTLLTEPVQHLYQVFRNEVYAVFRVHDFSVRYMPRSFDT